MDGINDPGNVGTIIRNADWFGVKEILLSENCADIYNPKTIRASAGSIFHLNIMIENNLILSLSHLNKKDIGYYAQILTVKIFMITLEATKKL